eukprot:3060728-Pyramimonas_sp.AAC.1
MACAELSRLQHVACKCIRGCAELTGVRAGACGGTHGMCGADTRCVHGCAELTGVREGAFGCTHCCLEMNGVREGAC